MKKFSEYVHTLHVPTSLNLVQDQAAARHRPGRARPEAGVRHGRQLLRRQRPLRQDRRPRVHRDRAARSSTWCCKHIFADLHEAWSHVARLDVEYIKSEINPHFANIVTPVRDRRGHQLPHRARRRRRRPARHHAVLDDRAAARDCSTPAWPAIASRRTSAGSARCEKRSRTRRSS